MVHRFTLIKPGTMAKRPTSASGGDGGCGPQQRHQQQTTSTHGWSALDFFFASGLLQRGGGAKCDVCTRRLGRKAVLECDDCGLRAHIKCGEVAPRDCGLRASSLTRISSAPQPAPAPALTPTLTPIPIAGTTAGGKVKVKSPSPFLCR